MRQALWPDSTAGEVDALLDDPHAAVTAWVAEGDAAPRLVGYAEVGTRPYAEGCDTSPVAYLEGIWVDTEARRRGVALALVRHAEAVARAEGVAELASDCAIDNEASRAFHIAAGFVEVERIICFRREIPASDGA